MTGTEGVEGVKRVDAVAKVYRPAGWKRRADRRRVPLGRAHHHQ